MLAPHLNATALLLGAQVVTAGSAFVVSLLAASVMAPAERGELALLLQIAYIATTVLLLGLERPMAAFASGPFFAAGQRSISLLAPALVPALGVVLVLGAVGAASQGSPVVVLAASTALFAITNVWTRTSRVAYLVSREWRPFAMTTALLQVPLVLGAVALVVLDVSEVSAWMALYVVASAVLAIFLVLHSRARTDPAIVIEGGVRPLYRKGVDLLPASLGNTAMLRADRLLLPLLASTAELGIYVIVATATELASSPVKQYADAMLRRWRERPATAREALRATALAGALGLAFAMLGGGVASAAIVLWLPEYLPALALLPALVAASGVYSATRIQQGMLIARGRTRAASAVEIIGMVCAVVLYAVLIPWLGAQGAAIGSLLGYGAALVAGALAARRREP